MRIAPIILVAAAAGMLAACEDYGPGYGYGYGPGYGPAYGYDEGPPVAVVGYDGFYDDYYGPFYDGYWGADGFFYYRDNDHDRWHRDRDRHFRHEAANPQFHPVQGHARPAMQRREPPQRRGD
jgi:hypothetical protein